MLRSRFLWTLYAGYSVLILLSAVVVGSLITQRIEKDALDEIKQSLQARAVLLSTQARNYLDKAPDPIYQKHIQILGAEIGTRLTVIRADGLVIADSEKNPAEMDNHGERPEILAVRSHGSGTATRFSDTLGKRMMYLALPVHGDDRLLGYVRTSLPLSAIDERIGYFRAAEVLGVGLAVALALVIGFLLARRVVEPLTSMTRVAESMAHGDYDQRLSTAKKGEIGKLAQALNRMAESCRDRMETINTDRNKLSAILDGMVEGVVAVNENERVLHINEAAANVLGTSAAECLDKPIWEVTRVREVCDILSTTLRTGRDAQGKFRLVAQSVDQVIEILASPLHDGQGKLVGAVVVLHDVSELHNLEKVRRDFVTNASHELKTPITAIRGVVETLIDDEEVPPEMHRRFLGKIRDQSVRLSTIVTDLLTLSRLEAENGKKEKSSFDLRDPVLTSVTALAPTSEEKEIMIGTQLPDTPVEVMGDEEDLYQVVRNLLDNALKYTPKGGKVDVRLNSGSDEAVLEVQDSGIGIEPADQDRVFERFYRVDKARSRELGGTGLGLSIVKHIVLSHGGRVSVASVPGEGSTFTVCIPLIPPSART